VSSIDGLDSKVLEDIFENSGLSFEHISKKVWKVSYVGETSDFQIMVDLNNPFVTLSINSYVFSPEDNECRLDLYTHLLKVNKEMDHAKFSLGEKGLVSLTMLITPLKRDPIRSLKKRLKSFCEYADNNYLDVLNIAQERHIS